MMDLFTLFVENTFGTLWLAIIGLSFIQFLILVFGGVSTYSILVFISLFLLAMSIGAGYMIITVPIVMGIITWTLLQIKKYLEES